jgi:thiosulfate/3-mercaptopyruvate sulfurtransferase
MSLALGPLVSATELASALEEGAPLVVLDTTWALNYEGDKSPAAGYAAGHLPGALPFDFRRVADPGSPLHDTVCSPEVFEAYARELGISDQHVVCYSQGRFSGAARAFWLFRLFGHERVSVLDGGLAQWRAEDRALSSEPSPTVEPGAFSASFTPRLFRDVAAMEAALEEGAQIVDARPPAVCSGEKDFFANLDSPATGRPGGFAGARNLTSGAVIQANGCLLPLDELAALAKEAGIDASAPTITTCSLGVGASAAAFALHLLGNHDVAVFDGAWEAWASRE